LNSTRTDEDRLLECFSAVFPGIPREQLRTADSYSLKGWDSVALVTLIAAVEEEFGITLAPDSYSGLTSFKAFLAQLN